MREKRDHLGMFASSSAGYRKMMPGGNVEEEAVKWDNRLECQVVAMDDDKAGPKDDLDIDDGTHHLFSQQQPESVAMVNMGSDCVVDLLNGGTTTKIESGGNGPSMMDIVEAINNEGVVGEVKSVPAAQGAQEERGEEEKGEEVGGDGGGGRCQEEEHEKSHKEEEAKSTVAAAKASAKRSKALLQAEIEAILDRTAEILLVLGSMADIRAGQPPSEKEMALAAECYANVASLVALVPPKAMVSKHTIEDTLKVLGLRPEAAAAEETEIAAVEKAKEPEKEWEPPVAGTGKGSSVGHTEKKAGKPASSAAAGGGGGAVSVSAKALGSKKHASAGNAGGGGGMVTSSRSRRQQHGSFQRNDSTSQRVRGSIGGAVHVRNSDSPLAVSSSQTLASKSARAAGTFSVLETEVRSMQNGGLGAGREFGGGSSIIEGLVSANLSSGPGEGGSLQRQGGVLPSAIAAQLTAAAQQLPLPAQQALAQLAQGHSLTPTQWQAIQAHIGTAPPNPPGTRPRGRPPKTPNAIANREAAIARAQAQALHAAAAAAVAAAAAAAAAAGPVAPSVPTAGDSNSVLGIASEPTAMGGPGDDEGPDVSYLMSIAAMDGSKVVMGPNSSLPGMPSHQLLLRQPPSPAQLPHPQQFQDVQQQQHNVQPSQAQQGQQQQESQAAGQDVVPQQRQEPAEKQQQQQQAHEKQQEQNQQKQQTQEAHQQYKQQPLPQAPPLQQQQQQDQVAQQQQQQQQQALQHPLQRMIGPQTQKQPQQKQSQQKQQQHPRLKQQQQQAQLKLQQTKISSAAPRVQLASPLLVPPPPPQQLMQAGARAHPLFPGALCPAVDFMTTCQLCKQQESRTQNIIVCDACESPFHIRCLQQPLTVIPEGDWFCSSCISEGKEKGREPAYGPIQSKNPVVISLIAGSGCVGRGGRGGGRGAGSGTALTSGAGSAPAATGGGSLSGAGIAAMPGAGTATSNPMLPAAMHIPQGFSTQQVLSGLAAMKFPKPLLEGLPVSSVGTGTGIAPGGKPAGQLAAAVAQLQQQRQQIPAGEEGPGTRSRGSLPGLRGGAMSHGLSASNLVAGSLSAGSLTSPGVGVGSSHGLASSAGTAAMQGMPTMAPSRGLSTNPASLAQPEGGVYQAALYAGASHMHPLVARLGSSQGLPLTPQRTGVTCDDPVQNAAGDGGGGSHLQEPGGSSPSGALQPASRRGATDMAWMYTGEQQQTGMMVAGDGKVAGLQRQGAGSGGSVPLTAAVVADRVSDAQIGGVGEESVKVDGGAAQQSVGGGGTLGALDEAGGGAAPAAAEWVGKPIATRDGKTFYAGCLVGGHLYRVQDCALFRPETAGVSPYIARVQSLWEDAAQEKWVRVNWCYYPSDIPAVVTRPHQSDPEEVYESNHCDNNLMASIQGPCEVLGPHVFYAEKVKRMEMAKRGGSPPALPPIYLCRWVYDAPQGSFAEAPEMKPNVFDPGMLVQ